MTKKWPILDNFWSFLENSWSVLKISGDSENFGLGIFQNLAFYRVAEQKCILNLRILSLLSWADPHPEGSRPPWILVISPCTLGISPCILGISPCILVISPCILVLRRICAWETTHFGSPKRPRRDPKTKYRKPVQAPLGLYQIRNKSPPSLRAREGAPKVTWFPILFWTIPDQFFAFFRFTRFWPSFGIPQTRRIVIKLLQNCCENGSKNCWWAIAKPRQCTPYPARASGPAGRVPPARRAGANEMFIRG